ncbi:unnamed protein product [Sympodiomycopsis kandeliae]
MANLTLYSVAALLLLDSAGNRIIAKYYSPPAAAAYAAGGAAPLPPNTPRQLVAQNPFSTFKDQRAFEKTVVEKIAKRGTSASGATEIQLLDSNLLLSKSSIDVHLVVVAPAEENELMVSSVLSNLWEAIGMLLAGQGIEKRSLLENLDLITLAVDEAIDDGIILETDPATIASRVSRPRPDATEIQINEQTIMSAYSSLKERVAQRILQG